MSLEKRVFAEFMGTFWLVFGGCGSAVLAAKAVATDTMPMGTEFGFNIGIGYVGVALAFGLTVLTMAYAVGGISGGHFNPAVTIGLATAGRFKWADVLWYVITQVVAAIAAAGVLYLILQSQEGFTSAGGFASNGFGEHSPGKFGMVGCLIAEFVLTFFFLIIILGTTDRLAPAGFAPLAIGLALTLIHLISIPVTNTSVNPARSTGPAIFAEPWALQQLWLFWVAPIAGAIVAGIVYPKQDKAKA